MPDPLVARVPRRVVTGHTADGASVVLSDGPVPVSRDLPDDGVAFHEVWRTTGAPAPITADEPEPTAGPLTVPPPPHGSTIRVTEFAPGHLDDRGLQSPVHRTASVDYGIVLEGELTLVLDEGREVVLHAGDVVVQRGTDHAWANRGDTVARVVFVLVDGAFSEALAAVLPLGGLMHGGPRD